MGLLLAGVAAAPAASGEHFVEACLVGSENFSEAACAAYLRQEFSSELNDRLRELPHCFRCLLPLP